MGQRDSTRGRESDQPNCGFRAALLVLMISGCVDTLGARAFLLGYAPVQLRPPAEIEAAVEDELQRRRAEQGPMKPARRKRSSMASNDIATTESNKRP